MPPIRLDHIAIALPRIAEAPSLLVAVLGGVPERSQISGVFQWASWTFAGGGRVEILEPRGRTGFSTGFSPRTVPASITVLRSFACIRLAQRST